MGQTVTLPIRTSDYGKEQDTIPVRKGIVVGIMVNLGTKGKNTVYDIDENKGKRRVMLSEKELDKVNECNTENSVQRSMF